MHIKKIAGFFIFAFFISHVSAQVTKEVASEENETSLPSDSTKKKIVKLPPLPSLPKKVLSDEDSIAQLNHHSSRYVFAPSAYPINKGAFYYQNYDLLLNDVQMGITDHFRMGIGYAFPLFMYLTPKYSLPLRKNHTLAVGDIAAFSVFTKASSSMWLNTLYGMYTIGNTKNNVSLGLGILQSSDLDGNHAITNLSGMHSITPNFYVVGEAWFNNRVRHFTSSYMDYVYDATKMDYAPKTISVDANLHRNTLFTSIQFRIIGHNHRTTAWSFGISSYWEHGERYGYDATVPLWDKIPGQVVYEKQSFVMGPTNKFIFIPSFTYVKKIADMNDVSK